MPETKTARIDLTDRGLLIVRINDGAFQTLDDAKENLAVAVSETRGARRPLLIDIRTAQPLDADARHHYSGATLVQRFSALALLIESSAHDGQRLPPHRAARHSHAVVCRGVPGAEMAERLPLTPDSPPSLRGGRVADLLKVLELMAAGDLDKRLLISEWRDELDAIAHGINVLVGELGWATARVVEAQGERAATAERASNAKNIFLRNMSHEIRTPIAAMLGIAELLASSALTQADRPELLRRLQANGLAVMSLLDDLLDLARLDAHKILFTPEQVSVIDVVRDVLASTDIESRAKSLEIRVEVTDEALGSIRTDRFRLRQILVNLVANAVKFTDAGGISVSLHAVNASRDTAEWTIDITDTGVGIAAEDQTHLFELFEQANPSITRTYGGNGLGLAISRKLAEQLGGTLVLLRSEPGQGTTFRLTLRPLTPPPQEVTPAGADAADTAGSIAGVRILLAEDHRDMHFALRASLEGAGAMVESARDGREAVDRAMSAPFDVVLMDLRMPNMDGLQATRALRRQGYAVPVIALTADPATLRRAEALDAGCDACLSKPFKVDDLIASIRLSTRAPG